MGRKLLAVATAMIAAFGMIGAAYMISTMMAPFYPKNLGYMTAAEMQTYMDQLPAGTYGVALAGYLVAAFVAGFIATKMGRRWSSGSTLAFVCGILLTAYELVSVFVWSQPMWFIVASVVLLIPASLIGYKFAHRFGHQHLVAHT